MHAPARATPTRLRWRSVLLVVAFAAGGLLACPLELERGVSCGDGWWDDDYEECDPKDPARSFVDACRARGFARDAECDPKTCELLDSDEQCNQCGDGVAAGAEECDGLDLRGQACTGGTGVLRCSDSCKLDYEDCPAVCNDGVVTAPEECDPSLQCGSDSDCGDDRVCYELTGECITIGEDFAPMLSCSGYTTTAIGINKPYASGTISRCTSECFFGRNNCGFCGDGQLDGNFDDFVYPGSGPVEFPAEVCDHDLAVPKRLELFCEPLCVDDPINSDVVVNCDFECSADCSGFVPLVVPDPSPESIGCCLAKGSPCPNFGTEGVPEFPCCSWLDNPEWLAEEKCVAAESRQIPITLVCP